MPSIDQSSSSSIRTSAKSKDYAEHALEAIVQVPHASDPPALLACLAHATEAIGATGSVYTAVIPEDGSAPSCFSLFACNPVFAQEQSLQGHLLEHPWLRFAQSHSTPGTQHQVFSQHDADSEAFALVSRYGFRSCLIVPTQAGQNVNRYEMLCLGSDQADDFEGMEARIVRTLARSLAAELHDWLTHYLQQRLQSDARLHEGDLNLLAMEWRGLGSKEISARTGMSVASVDSRFQRINTRLNCSSRKASAKRAAAYGLLESA
ncbi:autoinducer binding domain-containing protein [Paucibacter sp. KBW04]|uniref:autoinducer binding domain-containing protein n=1 Tax=Paucibacter sp. KBW04 TaxID=2153361 RepID=UPI000F5803C6|nr:autoinducer binding domain-containing protein [Paucibacter sp. KBW04]